jgi:hypothetical protein
MYLRHLSCDYISFGYTLCEPDVTFADYEFCITARNHQFMHDLTNSVSSTGCLETKMINEMSKSYSL